MSNTMLISKDISDKKFQLNLKYENAIQYFLEESRSFHSVRTLLNKINQQFSI